MLRKDSHGEIIQHSCIILVQSKNYSLIIRSLYICNVLVVAGDAGSQSLIFCKLFIGIYNILCGKILTVMPLHTITQFKGICIGIFIKGITFCKIFHWLSVGIIFHKSGKNKIRKLIVIIQKGIDRTL